MCCSSWLGFVTICNTVVDNQCKMHTHKHIYPYKIGYQKGFVVVVQTHGDSLQ